MIQCTCGAQNSSQSRCCWLCQRELASGPGPQAAPVVWKASAVPPASNATADLQYEASVAKQFALSSLVLFSVLIVFLIALLVIAPGLGILAAICLLPALVNSRAYVLRRQVRKQTISPVERLLVFFASVTTVVGIAGVGLVVAFSTFFVLCLGELALNRNDLQLSSLAALVAFGLTCLVGVGVAIFAWHFSSRK